MFWLFTIALLPTVFSFIAPNALSGLRISMSSSTRDMSNELVPRSYSAIEKDMLASLGRAISDKSTRNLIRIDVLTPGLNPKLEQKALLTQNYLFDLILSILPTLHLRYKKMKLLFPSIGDAASFQKYCIYLRTKLGGGNDESLSSWLPLMGDSIVFSDLRGGGLNPVNDRIDRDDELAFIISAKNLVGDPVLQTIKDITDRYSELSCLLLNCDLNDKVTTGMSDKMKREEFRKSFQQVYYFRNIVSIERPSLMPYELGALMFRLESGNASGGRWQIFACSARTPGSLNRFMKLDLYPRSTNDCTALNPPIFVLAGEFDSLPNRNEIDNVMSNAESFAAAAEIEATRAEMFRLDSIDSAVRLLQKSILDNPDLDVGATVIRKALKFLVDSSPNPKGARDSNALTSTGKGMDMQVLDSILFFFVEFVKFSFTRLSILILA